MEGFGFDLLSGVPLDVLTHLLVALAAGAVVGLERSYHGRPTGFRTHTLVCMASSALMLVTLYHSVRTTSCDSGARP